MPQLTTAATYQGRLPRVRRCPYQAKVMNRFDISSRAVVRTRTPLGMITSGVKCMGCALRGQVQAIRRRREMIWATWCRPCQAYIATISSKPMLRPCSGCRNRRAKSPGFSSRNSRTQRRCSHSSSVSEVSIGVALTSGSSAQRSCSYGLITGSSSVSASFIRTYALTWLSGT